MKVDKLYRDSSSQVWRSSLHQAVVMGALGDGHHQTILRTPQPIDNGPMRAKVVYRSCRSCACKLLKQDTAGSKHARARVLWSICYPW